MRHRWTTVNSNDFDIAFVKCYYIKATRVKDSGVDKVQRFSRTGPRGRGREWAPLGVHPLSWLLSNEKVSFVSAPHTSSNRLLLSNQDKGCTPSVSHSLPLPLGPALLNLSNDFLLRSKVLKLLFISQLHQCDDFLRDPCSPLPALLCTPAKTLHQHIHPKIIDI